MLVTGKKDELVARAFVTIENDVPILQTAEETKIEIEGVYDHKLKVLDEILPDPLRLKEGWLSEEESVKYWPMTLYPDIFNFLAFHPSELASKDLSDYKTFKAYNYYSKGWFSPFNYHSISKQSKLCIFLSACKPSQRISALPHKLWVCIEKLSNVWITDYAQQVFFPVK